MEQKVKVSKLLELPPPQRGRGSPRKLRRFCRACDPPSHQRRQRFCSAPIVAMFETCSAQDNSLPSRFAFIYEVQRQKPLVRKSKSTSQRDARVCSSATELMTMLVRLEAPRWSRQHLTTSFLLAPCICNSQECRTDVT